MSKPIARCSVTTSAILSILFFGGACAMQSSRSLISPVDDRVIHLSVDLPIPPQRAFAYFTESKLLQSWLTVAAEVEPKIGGKYDLFWEPADPENNSTIGCRVTALAPNELIAFQWRSPKQFKHFANGADPLTHVVVAFIPQASGTRVQVVHSAWRSTPEWEEARLWQRRAWEGVLRRLQEVAKP